MIDGNKVISNILGRGNTIHLEKGKTMFIDRTAKNMEKNRWICQDCGTVVVSNENPQPLRWKDGHTCRYVKSTPSMENKTDWKVK